MPGSSNTSFIPKRNPTSQNRQGAKSQVFLGTIIIRVLFFAVLLATAGVYAYETKLNKNLEAEVVKLNTAIASFNEAEMERVLQVDKRLKQVNERVQYSASMVAILKAIEDSTIGTTQINELSFIRVGDESYEISAGFTTDTFDSVLFQNEIYEKSDQLMVAEFEDVTLKNVPPDNGLYEGLVEGEVEETEVTFSAVLTITTDKIHHTVPQAGGQNIVVPQPTTVTEGVQNTLPIVAGEGEEIDPSESNL